jgi:hypothetical protein
MCVGLMLEVNTLGYFLQHLDTTLDRDGVNLALVSSSVNDVILGLQTPYLRTVAKLLGTERSTECAFPALGGITEDDIEYLKMLLWTNRRFFTFLCEKNLLPGCSIFLFVIFNMTLTNREPE